MSNDFIKMVADLSERRLLRTMQSLAMSKTPCAIFFAPSVAGNARQVVDSFKSGGLNLNCICVLTAEHKKFFQPVAGETLIAAEEFPTLPVKPKFILVLERYYGTAFMDYFKRFGTDMIFLPNIGAAENQYNLYMKHMPELYDVHEMLADDESKKVFRASIIGKVTNILQDFRFAPELQYFLNGLLPAEGDIAIDGGAYDGATSTDFAKQGAQVYAFEMDAKNYKNCIAPAEKFGFTIENLGLSNQIGTAHYGGGGMGSHKLADGVGGGCLLTSLTSTATLLFVQRQ